MQREFYIVIYETLPFLLLKWLPAIFSPEEKKVGENVFRLLNSKLCRNLWFILWFNELNWIWNEILSKFCYALNTWFARGSISWVSLAFVTTAFHLLNCTRIWKEINSTFTWSDIGSHERMYIIFNVSFNITCKKFSTFISFMIYSIWWA